MNLTPTKMSLKKLRNLKGFTLVELIIVIVIIGILSATMLPKIMGAPAQARDAKRKGDLQSISTALELYYLSNDAYPVDSGLITNGDLDTYVQSLQYVDPKDTGGYQYVYCWGAINGIAGQRFALATLLERGGVVADRVHVIGNDLTLVDTDPTEAAAAICDIVAGDSGGVVIN